jgi:hypothetical protein
LTPPPVTRFLFALPEGQTFTAPLSRHVIALSPDGGQMVYAANTRLYLRSMSEVDVHAIQGTDGYQAVTDPVFSPDGRSLVFYAPSDRTLKRIAVTGGAAVTICPADNPYGISWAPEDILFGQRLRSETPWRCRGRSWLALPTRGRSTTSNRAASSWV